MKRETLLWSLVALLSLEVVACGTTERSEPPVAVEKASEPGVPTETVVKPEEPARPAQETTNVAAGLQAASPVGDSETGKPSVPIAHAAGVAPVSTAGVASASTQVAGQAAVEVPEPVAEVAPEELTVREMAGDWLGVLDAKRGKLRIALHVRVKEDGSVVATFDSLDQGAAGLPVSSVTVEKGQFKVESKLLHTLYAGRILSKNHLDGTWEQGGMKLPFKMERSATPTEVRRPQDPKRPYPYKEEEVVIAGKDAGVTLAGTLTLPKAEGKVPAVLMVTGSGLQDRNETVAGHRPFLVLADHLTRAGIAVLRVDDRGFGASKGEVMSATSLDFARDVEAELEYLRQRPEVDAAKVGLVGHSEGAIIAAMLAARDPAIAFVVLLGGTGVTGREIVVRQVELNAIADGQPAAEVQRLVALQKEVFRMLAESPKEKVRQELHDFLMREAIPADIREAKTPEKKEALDAAEQALEQQIAGVQSPWFQFFLSYDPVADLEKVRCPVLALTGEKDTQVDPDVNLRAMGEAFARGGAKDVTTRKLAGLNHLFQTAKTGGVQEYASIEETFQPEALDLIAKWVLAKTAEGAAHP